MKTTNFAPIHDVEGYYSTDIKHNSSKSCVTITTENISHSKYQENGTNIGIVYGYVFNIEDAQKIFGFKDSPDVNKLTNDLHEGVLWTR